MAAPSCQIYLLLPPVIDPDLAKQLEAALGAGEVAAALLWPGDANPPALRALLADIVGTAHACGVPILLGNAAPADLGAADGVHVEAGLDGLRQARERLEPPRMVGAGGLNSRHAAMEAGEAGVDYVMFGSADPARFGALRLQQVEELTAWWAEIFQVPCVAPASSPEQAAALARAGADFVCVRDCVWRHPRGPSAAVAELAAALAKAEVAA